VAAIVVIGFEDVGTADEALPVLLRLQEQRLVNVKDWARVVRHADGKIDVEQAHDRAGGGAFAGALLGLVLGLVFMFPFGVLIGGTLGAVAGGLSKYGVDESFIQEVIHQIRPGTSALFLHVDHAIVDEVLRELKSQFRMTLISSTLPTDSEERLRAAIQAATPV